MRLISEMLHERECTNNSFLEYNIPCTQPIPLTKDLCVSNHVSLHVYDIFSHLGEHKRPHTHTHPMGFHRIHDWFFYSKCDCFYFVVSIFYNNLGFFCRQSTDPAKSWLVAILHQYELNMLLNLSANGNAIGNRHVGSAYYFSTRSPSSLYEQYTEF